MESILRDMQTKELNDFAASYLVVELFENDPETLPRIKEELDLHMQLTYNSS